MRRFAPSRAVVAVLASAITATTTGGLTTAIAQTASGEDAVTMCISRLGADVRFVFDPAECAPGEIVRTWNVQGPQGEKGDPGEAGPQGRTGPQGERGPRGRSGSSNLEEFRIELAFGESETFAQHGPFTLTADCTENVSLGGLDVDRVRILAATTEDGAVMGGNDPRNGGSLGTLDSTDAADDRELTVFATGTGTTNVGWRIDQSWVLSPSGQGIHLDGEVMPMGLSYGGTDCLIQGYYVTTG